MWARLFESRSILILETFESQRLQHLFKSSAATDDVLSVFLC